MTEVFKTGMIIILFVIVTWWLLQPYVGVRTKPVFGGYRRSVAIVLAYI